MDCAYRFVLDVRTLSGSVLFSRALEPDWEPALQATRLAGLRTLGVWHHDGDVEPSVVPLWHASAGQPTVHEFRVRMSADGREWSSDFRTTEYFADTARAVVAAQLAAGQLAPSDRVRYSVTAYPADRPESDGHRLRLMTVDRPQPLVLQDRAFSTLAARSLACGDADPSDVAVVLPELVLNEVCLLTQQAGEHETGGILIGHLYRDESKGDIGLEVTAQIPARHTVSQPEKLTFTSETWTDVRNAVALRRAEEKLIGWWHSHPAFQWCAECPIERQRVCQYATGFLSPDDKALHRSVFPSAFTQALVITRSISGLDARMFGWRDGVLRPRGFRLIRHDDAGHSLALESVRTASSIGEAACVSEPGSAKSDPIVVTDL